MTTGRRTALLCAAALFSVLAAGLAAHLITFRGTVLEVEPARVQVKAVDEAGKEIKEPMWFAPTADTKILRGERRVSLAEAAIKVSERIVVIVNHVSDDEMTVVEIRLAEAK